MAKEKEQELTEDQLAILNEAFPVVEGGNSRISLPRIGFLAKDIIEETGTGKNKKITVLQSMGTFFLEKPTDDVETGADGKVRKVWERTYLEDEESIEGIIVYHRRQLRIYDASLKKFISSPIFDNSTQEVPLYLDGRQIAKGTQKDLQAKYPALTQKGKPTSDLKEEAILYVIYEGELFQFNLKQSWGFKDYAKKVNPSTVVTTIGSVEETFGTNTYRKNTFSMKKKITSADFDLVKESVDTIKDQVESDKRFYLPTGDSDTMKELGAKDVF